MTEIWKPIEGYEDYYEVSSHGRVRSFTRVAVTYSNGGTQVRKGKIRIGTIDKGTGYARLLLCVNGNQKSFNIHRLVAIAFISNPESKPQVNHKDGNKSNNHVDNLEWSTAAENVQHSISTGLVCNTGSDSTSAKPIVTCRGDEFGSAVEAAHHFGMPNHRNISKVCKGVRQHSGKYSDGTKIKWKYKNTAIDN